MSDIPWHAFPAEDILQRLESFRDGLSSEEAARRLQQHGPNRLPAARRRGPLRRFLAQLDNLLILILIGAAILSLLLDHPVDALVILAVVVVNAGIGFLQEGRAEQAIDRIRTLVDPKATVLRDGARKTIAADEIVPGDVVLLEAGDRVPADLRLLHARALSIDEAVLTGESVPVEKRATAVSLEAPLQERHGMAFKGTLVATGQARGVAVATGAATELGRISTLLGQVETLKTPLLAQMDRFARQLTLVVMGLSLVAFFFAVRVRQDPWDDAFMIVVGLAVAAIPEGLPAILSITLALGVQRMAGRRAIIRRLPAVETLGSVSTICSDKTGTLTRNEMMVAALELPGQSIEVSGSGYAPEGVFTAGGATIDPSMDTELQAIARCALLCNDSRLSSRAEGWMVDGDPMEGALLALAAKAGLDLETVPAEHRRLDEIPFDARHRYMATLNDTGDGPVIHVKGAPEAIIARARILPDGRAIDPAAWHDRASRLAEKGQRVLAFARGTGRSGQTSLRHADLDDGLTLLGLMGFIDPPRPEAIAAVAECRSAGIRPVMITGDHAGTALAIGRQLGLADDPQVMTGAELDRLDATGIASAVSRTQVFARTTPEHKLTLVAAFQALGESVAMTGDGVNDAPALKRADVGIAMGIKGTEAAKEAADMVLADDNFASIVAAVREGRTVYDNLVKVIGWTLPTNGGEALTILAALALGWTLPITPVQILWINMVTAVALGLTLAFEPPEPGLMRRRPRPRKAPLLSLDLVWRIAFVSLLFVAGAFGIFFWAEAQGLPIETARTLVVNTIVAMEVFYLFNVRFVHGPSLTASGILGTPAVLIGVSLTFLAQLAFTFLPVFNRLFTTTPISLGQGLLVIGIGIALFLMVEGEKWLRARLRG
ncbi:HAD-IC family P-type ATPase [Thermaurantiacus sp.]